MPVVVPMETPGEAVAPPNDGATNAWPDESGESAFLAEAHERGEPMAPAKLPDKIADPADAGALPALNDLVQRIPAEVREALEELFRAKFVAVKRVPLKALKE